MRLRTSGCFVASWSAELSGELEKKDRMLLIEGILKCADISKHAKTFAISQAWAFRAVDEFWRQGDIERQSRIKASPHPTINQG